MVKTPNPELALDLGGNQTLAVKEIEKDEEFYLKTPQLHLHLEPQTKK